MNKMIFITLLSISTFSYANDDFSDELKLIYKHQYQLRNANLQIRNKLEKNLYLDIKNNTNTHQRFVANLFEELIENYDQLEILDNKLNYVNQMITANSLSLYRDSPYIEELKRIYKQQLQLKNENLNIKAKINSSLKFDAINNTNIRQRHIDNLIEKINRNNNQFERLDNRLVYIEQMIQLENSIAFETENN